MLEPPSSPLPFGRSQVFGLDLRQHSSLSAYQWLVASNNPPAALIVVPIDADVVLALGEGEIQEAALAATDSLVAAGAGSPLAMCLRRPAVMTDAATTAEIAVEALIDRYPDVIAYVFACNFKVDHEWQSVISAAMEAVNPRISGSNATLLPVAGGAPASLIDTDNPADLRPLAEGVVDTLGYVVISIEVETPITTRLLADAQFAILESPHVGLVLLRPTAGSDPLAVGAAIDVAPVAPDSLLTGFSNATMNAIVQRGEWQTMNVGTVEYLRTSAPLSVLEASFVGTDVYVHCVRSPNAGRILVWIDPVSDALTEEPTLTFELTAGQARDVAIPVAAGLPASRHRIVLAAQNHDGSSVMISGIFVSGSPTQSWIGGLAAAGFLLAAAASLADRCAASVASIRRSTRPPSPGKTEHPREFARRR